MQQALQQPQTLCIKHLAKTIVSVGLSKTSLLVCKVDRLLVCLVLTVLENHQFLYGGWTSAHG